MEIDWQQIMKEKPKMKSYSVYLNEDLVDKIKKELDNTPLSTIINNIFKQIMEVKK